MGGNLGWIAANVFMPAILVYLLRMIFSYTAVYNIIALATVYNVFKQVKMDKIKNILVLHLLLFLYSICSLCSKKASGFDFLSLGFIFFYGIMIILLGLYAIFWQQIIKKLPLTFAFANKAVTVIWGMMWGVLVFHEHLSVGKFIGAAVIICGIVLFNYSGEKS